MTREYAGGCHCGAVRYSCSDTPELTFFCHCSDCQRTTGSPFSVELMVGDSTFQAEGPLEAYEVTGDSGKPVRRWHCIRCASGVYLDCDADPGYVFIKAGTLDDAGWVAPSMYIFTAAKQPWVKLDDGLPQYPRAPDA